MMSNTTSSRSSRSSHSNNHNHNDNDSSSSSTMTRPRPTSSSSSSSITAYLCDSRSCNQMGGGEHLKADIEDLLQLKLAAESVSVSEVQQHHQHQQHEHEQQQQHERSDGDDNDNGIVGPKVRVTLTTCYGLCNRSPNMKLKSTVGSSTVGNNRGGLLQAPRGRGRRERLRNDGGLRMRVEVVDNSGSDSDDHDEMNAGDDPAAAASTTTTTDVVTISDITIQKVARALGLLLSQSHSQNNSPHEHDRDRVHVHAGVRAIECKSAGNKCLTAGRYKEALHHYTRGRRCLSLSSYTNRTTTTDNSTSNASTGTSEEEGDDNDDNGGTASITMPLVHQSQPYQSLQASLWLCCAKTRVQWAAVSLEHEADDDDEQHEHENDTNNIKHLLQIAAADTCQVLRAYYLTRIGIGNDDDADADHVETEGTETVTTIMDAVIATLVHRCDAGLETLGMRTAAAAAETEYDNDANGKEERNKIPVDGQHEAEANEAVPLTNDVQILVQHCITLADAWRGLASQGIYTPALAPARAVTFQEGALMAYKGVLRIAAAPPASTSNSTSRTKASASSRAAARLLRAKERRRIEAAIAGLS
jgi:hypothetical protein